MKFSVSSADLLKQLQIASGAIGSNPVLPILEDFLFDISLECYMLKLLISFLSCHFFNYRIHFLHSIYFSTFVNYEFFKVIILL